VYLLSICLLADAQQVYTYLLTDGWQATKAFDYGDDTCVIVGLVSDPNPSTNHRFHFTIINGENEVLKVDTFRLPDSDYVSYNYPFGVSKSENMILIAGIRDSTDGKPKSTIYSIDKSKGIVKIMDESIGYVSSLAASIYDRKKNHMISFGSYLDSSRDNSYQSYLNITYDTGSVIKSFNNNNLLSKYNPINLFAKQLIQSKDLGFLLVNEIKPRDHPFIDIHQGLIIKVDSLGTEQWRLPIWEDSTTVYDLVVVPLDNGSFLAVYQDRWYQPIKNPEGHPYLQSNERSVTQLVEFNDKGEIVRKWNLRKELENKLGSRRYLNSYSHYLLDAGGNILLVGSARDNGKYGYDIGFLLKLDKNGQYLWYRQYELSIATPYNGGKENIFSHGITALKKGGYALAGEYRSDPSDSFPNGTQKGLVLFVDEYGCMEPGCQENDNIGVRKFEATQKLFKVFPVPSNGYIDIRSDTRGLRLKKAEVYNMQGRLIYTAHSLTNGLNGSHLTSNIYYLKLYRSDGFHETHKIIIQ
jgi:hypothetical protein